MSIGHETIEINEIDAAMAKRLDFPSWPSLLLACRMDAREPSGRQPFMDYSSNTVVLSSIYLACITLTQKSLLLSIVPHPTYANTNHVPGERFTLPIGLFLYNTWHFQALELS